MQCNAHHHLPVFFKPMQCALCTLCTAAHVTELWLSVGDGGLMPLYISLHMAEPPSQPAWLSQGYGCSYLQIAWSLCKWGVSVQHIFITLHTSGSPNQLKIGSPEPAENGIGNKAQKQNCFYFLAHLAKKHWSPYTGPTVWNAKFHFLTVRSLVGRIVVGPQPTESFHGVADMWAGVAC